MIHQVLTSQHSDTSTITPLVPTPRCQGTHRMSRNFLRVTLDAANTGFTPGSVGLAPYTFKKRPWLLLIWVCWVSQTWSSSPEQTPWDPQKGGTQAEGARVLLGRGCNAPDCAVSTGPVPLSGWGLAQASLFCVTLSPPTSTRVGPAARASENDFRSDF